MKEKREAGEKKPRGEGEAGDVLRGKAYRRFGNHRPGFLLVG